MDDLTCVTIHTDGACTGNPGPGGYGVILRLGSYRRELSAGYRLTTNNRMELRAAIEGLQVLTRRCHVLLYSDSKYLVDAMTEGWPRRGEAKVEFAWVKGHAGGPDNERCDRMAVRASQQADLLDDEGYGMPPPAPLFD